MNNDVRKIIFTLGVAGVTLATSLYAYKLITNREPLQEISKILHKGVKESINAAAMKNENSVLHAAQLTHNPEINQKWLEQQWKSVGYLV